MAGGLLPGTRGKRLVLRGDSGPKNAAGGDVGLPIELLFSQPISNLRAWR